MKAEGYFSSAECKLESPADKPLLAVQQCVISNNIYFLGNTTLKSHCNDLLIRRLFANNNVPHIFCLSVFCHNSPTVTRLVCACSQNFANSSAVLFEPLTKYFIILGLKHSTNQSSANLHSLLLEIFVRHPLAGLPSMF